MFRVRTDDPAFLKMVNDAEKQLQESIAETAQKIAGVYDRTQAAYQKNRTVPNEGVHYPLRYMKILKEKRKMNRFNFLRGKKSAICGYLKGFESIETEGQGFKISSKEKSASGALDKALKGISLIACAEACQIAQWQGIRKVLGDKKFDALFGPSSPFKLTVRSRQKTEDNPLNRLRKFTSDFKQDIQLGDMVYIQNMPEYKHYHPNGSAAGYNAICVSKESNIPKVTIHGLKPEGESISDVGENLYRALLKSPLILEADELPEGSSVCSYPAPKSRPQISFEEFAESGGGVLNQRMWIDPQKVTILNIHSSERGIEKLKNWKARRLDKKASTAEQPVRKTQAPESQVG